MQNLQAEQCLVKIDELKVERRAGTGWRPSVPVPVSVA